VARHRCIKGSAALSAVVLAETVLHRMLGSYRKHIDRFVVPSRFYIDKFCEWGWPRERFTYVPNFVDVEALRPRGEPGTAFTYIGRLSPEKGLRTLIRAAAAARQPVRLAGVGPQEAELRALAAELQADVTFLGYQTGDALHATIAGSRAIVLPSEWYENAPISILEAYALGRPVIGARIGGIPELIHEGDTGATFRSRDADALAACLSRFAAMPLATVTGMGTAGRRLVQAEFSVARYRERMSAVYAELLGAPA
jgi:glycosyltransferase involved in cell wall biosynthesis